MLAFSITEEEGMSKLVCGVGVNDADYVIAKSEITGYVNGKKKLKQVWTCPFYRAWVQMLKRCFSEKYKAKNPTYKDVTCCEEWLTFSNFKRWMEKQDWQGKQLDKDIIFTNNKVYSPETCAFVSGVTNSFVLASDATIVEYPLGVHWDKESKKLRVRCCNPFTKKKEHLGYFRCPKEAHETWRKRKHELAQLVAETEADPRIVEALKKRYSIEEWYAPS